MFGESAHAEVFQYTDSDGTVVFVDEADKVPNRYWKQAILRQTSNAAESPSKSRSEFRHQLDVTSQTIQWIE